MMHSHTYDLLEKARRGWNREVAAVAGGSAAVPSTGKNRTWNVLLYPGGKWGKGLI